MPVKKIKVSGLPDVGNIDDFEVLGVNARNNTSAKANMAKLRDGAIQAQSDWNQTDAAERDYIKNKPDVEVVDNKKPISSTAGVDEYPTSQSVFSLVMDIAATIPAGGLKTPVSIDAESQLPDVQTLAVGDYFFIQNMDLTAPDRTGRAWVNYIDHDPAKPLMFYKVFDQYQSMDGVSITQTGSGAWEVNLTWLGARISSLVSTAVGSSVGTLLFVQQSLVTTGKVRVWFDTTNDFAVQVWMTGGWYGADSRGITLVYLDTSGRKKVLVAEGGLHNNFYVSALKRDATTGYRYLDIIHRRAGLTTPDRFSARIEALPQLGGVPKPRYETLSDATPEEQALDNINEMGTVGTSMLPNGVVTTDKLATGSVSADKMAAGAVTTEKLSMRSFAPAVASASPGITLADVVVKQSPTRTLISGMIELGTEVLPGNFYSVTFAQPVFRSAFGGSAAQHATVYDEYSGTMLNIAPFGLFSDTLRFMALSGSTPAGIQFSVGFDDF